jgi:hypothetical protein
LKFKQLIAKYYFEQYPSDNLQDIALKGLEEGLDSPSLCILAGLEENETPSIIDHYFEQTLIELDIQLPRSKKEALEYAASIIDEMCAGNLNVVEGTYDIMVNVLERFSIIGEDKFYYCDSIGFEKAYGLYFTYDDLSKADYDWQPGKSNQQLMTEVEKHLLDELKNWKLKIGELYNWNCSAFKIKNSTKNINPSFNNTSFPNK